jgi:hypoxanthine phosphoribosyltransferase
MTDIASSAPPPAGEVLIPKAAIRARIGELGEKITADLSNADGAPLLIGVLKGSAIFMADLARSIPLHLEFDFMSISTYAQTGPQSGVVRILKDLDLDIAGRDVLMVEDIVDTGLTLTYLLRSLGSRKPRSIRTVTLLDKSARRIVPVPVEYVGFEIPDVFVVGYGLDFQGRYRNVGDILAINDVPRLASDPALLVPDLFGLSRNP